MPSADQQCTRYLEFLESVHAAEMDHSDGSLLTHLVGVHTLLSSWGAAPHVCNAGLFHSVYSTEAYPAAAAPLSRRPEVEALIGPDAERLVWLFCVMERDSFDANLRRREKSIVNRLSGDRIGIVDHEFLDLVNLSCANTLEAMPRLSWTLRRTCRRYLTRYLDVAMPEASAAIIAARGRFWQCWR